MPGVVPVILFNDHNTNDNKILQYGCVTALICEGKHRIMPYKDRKKKLLVIGLSHRIIGSHIMEVSIIINSFGLLKRRRYNSALFTLLEVAQYK